MSGRAVSLALAIVAMLVATAAAAMLKPRELMARSQKEFRLEDALPTAFGQWRAASDMRLVEPPGSDTLSREIYNQEVARGYVDPRGRLVMLLIAYGESQSERLQLHRPEVCYAAQGFFVSRPFDALVSYGKGEPGLAVRRLMTRREERVEPITYWMRIGYDVSEGLLERQRLKLEYGLRGLIPDGALFRVSTLGVPQADSYDLEDKFIRDLIGAVDPEMRVFMVGVPNRAFIARAPT